MQPSLNHNVKHKDKIYHVQTEDRGSRNPIFQTDVFYEGKIIHSFQQEYKPNQKPEVIKQFMIEQHKFVIRQLMNGEFHEQIDQLFRTK